MYLFLMSATLKISTLITPINVLIFNVADIKKCSGSSQSFVYAFRSFTCNVAIEQ